MKNVTITFEPIAHKYTDEFGNVYTSVTTLLNGLKKKYDTEFWAVYRALDKSGYKLRPNPEERKIWVGTQSKKGNWYSVPSILQGIVPMVTTASEVNINWKRIAEEACSYGTEKHNEIESGIESLYTSSKKDEVIADRALQIHDNLPLNKINSEKLISELSIHPKIKQLLENLVNKGYTLYAEHRVYSYDHLVSGTIDLLCINDKKEFIIVDWKTNKDEIKFESGYYKKEWNATRTEKVKTNKWIKTNTRLLVPFEHLFDCKGNIYGLQLALYARICELWGYTFKGSCLVHIRRKVTADNKPIFKTDGTHDFYEPKFYNFGKDDYREETNYILQNQKNVTRIRNHT
jgi:hypothetical protein